MHLLEALADGTERLPEPGLEGALELFIHSRPHLLELRRVVFLQDAQPVFDRLPKGLHAPFGGLGHGPELRGERLQALGLRPGQRVETLVLDLARLADPRVQRGAEPRDRLPDLLPQGTSLSGRFGPGERHLVPQGPPDLGLASLDRGQPGIDRRQIDPRRPHQQRDEQRQRDGQEHDGQDEQ